MKGNKKGENYLIELSQDEVRMLEWWHFVCKGEGQSGPESEKLYSELFELKGGGDSYKK